MSALPRKARKGSARKRERWLRNHIDSHDPNSHYDEHRFGHFANASSCVPDENDSDVLLPSELFKRFLANDVAKTLLDPLYKARELQFFRQFLDLWPYCLNVQHPPNIRRKDLKTKFYDASGEQQILQII